MDKYRKVQKPKEAVEKAEEEIRLTATGSISAYVSRAAKLFNELEKSKIIITATGNALTKAVTTAEVIKRRFKGLHQITKIGSTEIVDEYEPIEEGLDKVTDTRTVPFVEITLSKDSLDSSDLGYQAPIDESLVKDYDPEEMIKSRGRGGGRGKSKKGKGKGKGKDAKGKGKGKGKEAPSSKGKGKGKEASKGKGKGKAAEPAKGKSKGKGKAEVKGKGKGKEAPAKGKGKGKSSKGSSKGYDSYDSYGSPPKGKGKKGGKGGKDDYSKGKGKGKSKGKSSWGSW